MNKENKKEKKKDWRELRDKFEKRCRRIYGGKYAIDPLIQVGQDGIRKI